MPLPTAAQLHAIESPAGIQRVLARADIAEAPIGWWATLIAATNGGLSGAELGEDDYAEWAAVLVQVLDAARTTSALGVEETLHRKMNVRLALLRRFGPAVGDPNRDPDRIFEDFLAEVGYTAQELIDESTGLRQDLIDDVDRRQLSGRLIRLLRIRDALRSLREIVPYMNDGPLRQDAARWAELVGSIDAATKALH